MTLFYLYTNLGGLDSLGIKELLVSNMKFVSGRGDYTGKVEGFILFTVIAEYFLIFLNTHSTAPHKVIAIQTVSEGEYKAIHTYFESEAVL